MGSGGDSVAAADDDQLVRLVRGDDERVGGLVVHAARLDLDTSGSVEVVESFTEARDEKLAKGEALVCHVVGTGDTARVVAVERHLP